MNFDFSTKIAALRREKGIPQKQAAEDLGISQALLSHYEKGIRECNLEFVKKIAEYYSVTSDYLLGLSDTKQGFNEIFETSDLPSDNKINAKTILRCLIYLSNSAEFTSEAEQLFFADFFSLSIEKYLAFLQRKQSYANLCDMSINLLAEKRKGAASDNAKKTEKQTNTNDVPLCITTSKQHSSLLISNDIKETLNKE